MKKIFVIIVTYNGMKWIDKCLHSLTKSTIPLIPIIIDNNSTDETVEYIYSHFPEIHLINTGENLGFGKANNVGIKYALEHNADGVFLLNQDAYIFPDTIEKLLPFMDSYGIVSPIHLDGGGTRLDRGFINTLRMSPNMLPLLIEDLLLNRKCQSRIYEVPFINAAAWLLSKETLNKIGGFDPIFFHYGEDENYCHRILFHQMKVGFVSSSFVCHDRNQNTLSSVFLQKQNERFILVECMNILSEPYFLSYNFLFKQTIYVLILFCFFRKNKAMERFSLLFFLIKNKKRIKEHRVIDSKKTSNWL